MKQKFKMILPIVAVIILTLSGCYPDKIDSVTEQDFAATLYDDTALPGDYLTFSVVDTVVHMTDDGEDDSNLSREHDDFILSLIRQNMLDMGYDEITNPAAITQPELLLLVSAKPSDYYGMYWWDYWGWYPGWGYPGWGYPSYPWYPGYPWPPVVYYSYTTGTVIIDMMDTENLDPEEHTSSIIWSGIVEGILVKNSELTRSRLEKQINQLFIQSPYLQK